MATKITKPSLKQASEKGVCVSKIAFFQTNKAVKVKL
jgi:hypothetical protein